MCWKFVSGMRDTTHATVAHWSHPHQLHARTYTAAPTIFTSPTHESVDFANNILASYILAGQIFGNLEEAFLGV